MEEYYQEEISGSILIVDDEETILKSLGRQLSEENFEVYTSDDPFEGLNILKREKIDVVISDLRMSRMDGTTFLGMVKTEDPEVERIILTGLIDENSVVQLITRGIAAAYFTKPWDINRMVISLRKFLYNKKRYRGTKLLSKISQIDELPSYPEIYRQFMEALNMDKSMREVESILQRDISITAKILQVANSAFYGIRPTSSLLRAMMVIGLDAVRDIVLTFSLINQLRWSPDQLKELEEICNHSFLLNKYFYTFYKLRYNKSLSSQYTSVGITHDIGKIIMLQYFPNVYHQIKECCQSNSDCFFYDCELKNGFEGETHSELGAYFLKGWDIPDMSTNVALYHHTPDSPGVKDTDLMHTINFADRFVDAVASGELEMFLRNFPQDWISKDELKNFAREIEKESMENYLF